MKIVFLVWMVLASQIALAEDYTVKEITWCNGPHAGSDGSTCPSYAHWEGVQIKYLKTATIDLDQSAMIRLTDSKGAQWEKDLGQCKSNSWDAQGCRYTVDNEKEGEVSIFMSIWTFNSSAQYLSMTIKNGKELNIHSPDNSFFWFSVSKN